MDDHAVPPDIPHVSRLNRLCARIRAGDRPGQVEVERELESGFGRLIGLEAELARARKRASDPVAPSVEDLMHQITELRDVLTELRTLSTAEEPPRIGYGFVLPGPRTKRPPSSTRGMPDPWRN